MTEKHWFIFRGDHHLGPFTFEEILDKVKLAEIDDDELTWCEGNQDWLPVNEQPAIKRALQTEESHQHDLEKSQKLRQAALESKLQEQLVAQQHAQEEIKKEEIKKEEIKKEEARRLQELALQKQKEQVPPELPQKNTDPNFAEDGPPPLPPLPIDDQSFQDEVESNLEEGIEEESAPSALTEMMMENANLGEDLQVFTFVESSSDGDSYEENDQEKNVEEDKTGEFTVSTDTQEQGLSGLRLYGAVALTLIGLGLFVYLIMQTITDKRQLYNVAGRDKDALYNVMKRPFKGVPIHRMRPTKDLNSLWLATNFPDEAVLYMTLKIVPGRFIGNGLVEVQAQAQLKGGAALFDELEVLKGDTLHIGEYSYEIKGKRVGLKGKLSEALGQKSLLKDVQFIRKKDQEFVLKGKLLLSPYGQDKFEAKLVEHQQYIQKTVIRPLKDRLERYKTFMGLLDRMGRLYQNTMGRITKGKSIYLFENRYNEEVGPFLRDLIIDNNRLQLSLLNLEPDDSKAYGELMNYGKDIGIVASEMVTKTRKYRTLGKKRTLWLLDYFSKKVEDLRLQGMRVRQKINNDLAPFVESEKSP